MRWLLHAATYLHFDIGYRERQFLEWIGDVPILRRSAHEYVSVAAELVARYRKAFVTAGNALEALLKGDAGSPGDWPIYNAAILAGVEGRLDLARELFDRLLAEKAGAPWQVGLAQRPAELRRLLSEGTTFRGVIEGEVARSREALKLPSLAFPVLPNPTRTSE